MSAQWNALPTLRLVTHPYCVWFSQSFINTERAVIFDAIATAANAGAEGLALKYPQVKILDIFTLFEVSLTVTARDE